MSDLARTCMAKHKTEIMKYCEDPSSGMDPLYTFQIDYINAQIDECKRRISGMNDLLLKARSITNFRIPRERVNYRRLQLGIGPQIKLHTEIIASLEEDLTPEGIRARVTHMAAFMETRMR